MRADLDAGGRRWLFRVKSRAVSLAVDGTDNYTFDLEGRPYAAFVGGRNYRRGLDGRVLLKVSGGDSSRRVRRFLGPEEQRLFAADVRARIAAFGAAARAGGLLAAGAAEPAALRAWLERLERWDEAALAAHAARFHQVYRTVSILPPDQYMALVVQSSEGCPWNRCTFCGLYRDRRFRLKSMDEVAAHVGAIVELLGAGLRLRRSVFLGDANALHAPAERLLQTMAVCARQLGAAGGPPGPFYGFADAASVLRHTPAALAALRRAGLRRLYLGLESGNEWLLEQLGKPSSAADAVAAVARLRAAGLRAGIIVLLGIGGRVHAEAHERDTVAVLRAMALGSGDIVYFSPLLEEGGLAYARQRQEQGWGALAYEDMVAQQDRMGAALEYPPGAPLTSRYDIRDFVY